MRQDPTVLMPHLGQKGARSSARAHEHDRHYRVTGHGTVSGQVPLLEAENYRAPRAAIASATMQVCAASFVSVG